MIITMLEAEVPDQHTAHLIESFGEAGGPALPPQISQSFLAHEAGTERWRVITVWNDRRALEDYRESVPTPGGVLMFRSVGAEPTLTIHEVAEYASHA